MIVGVLTTCHTQYTWDRSICIFLFNRTTLQVFVTCLIGSWSVVLLNKKKYIYMRRRRGRRSKKLLDDLRDRKGYCQLKEEALDRTMWRNRFGRGFGPVVWQITDDDDDDIPIKYKNKYAPNWSLLCMTSC